MAKGEWERGGSTLSRCTPVTEPKWCWQVPSWWQPHCRPGPKFFLLWVLGTGQAHCPWGHPACPQQPAPPLGALFLHLFCGHSNTTCFIGSWEEGRGELRAQCEPSICTLGSQISLLMMYLILTVTVQGAQWSPLAFY
jgi:hypothetical protein